MEGDAGDAGTTPQLRLRQQMEKTRGERKRVRRSEFLLQDN